MLLLRIFIRGKVDNMAKFRYCRSCGSRFAYTRDDQQFCSPKCVAKFYRDNPNPEHIHAANVDEFWHECENCHTEYFVNGYAQRGGKRAPKYCSVECKQAAYRVRKQATQEQAARRNEQNVGNKSSSGTSNQHKQQSAPPPPPPAAKRAGVHSFKHVGTNRHTADATGEALRILGLMTMVTPHKLKKAYVAMISHWHPDRNPDPEAGEWAKAINWAYDYLKY
jgi:hypothetical protein